MNNKNFILFSFFFAIIFSVSVFAISTSVDVIGLPCAFYGKVKIGSNYVSGTLVTAYLNNTGEYLTTSEEVGEFGNYSIIINNVTNNSYIKFKILGINADQTEKLCLLGNDTYLDLTDTPLPDDSSCESNLSCYSGYCVECNGQKICRPSKPFVGDGCCQTGENCANSIDCPCPSDQVCDAGTCTTPSGPLILPTLCEENWSCTEWSDCLNEAQTRTCTDLSECGTNSSKPSEVQDCFIPLECEENWSCSDWSSCVDNLQNKTCADLNNCGTQTNKPEETQGCEEPKEEQQMTEAPTGLFSGLNTFNLLTTSIIGLVFLTIFLFILKRRKSKSNIER